MYIVDEHGYVGVVLGEELSALSATGLDQPAADFRVVDQTGEGDESSSLLEVTHGDLRVVAPRDDDHVWENALDSVADFDSVGWLLLDAPHEALYSLII